MKRNSKGQFTRGNKITPEHREKMLEGKQKKKIYNTEEEKAQILDEMGLESSPLVESIVDDWVINRKIGSLTRLFQLSPSYKTQTIEKWDPDSGIPCPTCGGDSQIPEWFTSEYLDNAIRLIDDEIESRGITQEEREPEPLIQALKKDIPELPELTPEERGYITE